MLLNLLTFYKYKDKLRESLPRHTFILIEIVEDGYIKRLIIEKIVLLCKLLQLVGTLSPYYMLHKKVLEIESLQIALSKSRKPKTIEYFLLVI